MDRWPPTAIVGNHNITGTNLTNVGNRTYIYAPQLETRQPPTLDSIVAFDALLNSRARYPAPRCHPETRLVVQDIAKKWICRKGEAFQRSIMWISGGPGVGKSALLQTVCEVLTADGILESIQTEDTIEHEDKPIDGSFFFGRGLGNREKASFLPATIAYQISLSRPSCHHVIQSTITSTPSILYEAFPSQFRKLVLRTANTIEPSRPITIIIDALDECDSTSDQVELLELIFEAVQTKRMRFLIASRPEQAIDAFFQRSDVSRHTYHVRLDEKLIDARRDIETFLRAEFARIRRLWSTACTRLPNGEEWPGNAVIIQLADDADYQFIFAHLIIGYIDTPFFPPNQQLQNLLAAPPLRAFSKLDALYDQILCRCPPGLHEGDDELVRYRGIVKAILQVIIAWPGGPFSITNIAQILHEPADVVRSIVRGPMRSLFKFDAADPYSPIILCHKSLRDYLLDRKRSKELFISSGDADSLFSEILSRQLLFHPYCSEALMSVLTAMLLWWNGLTVPQLAAISGVDTSLIEVVIFGPARLFFAIDFNGKVTLSTPFIKSFLEARNRSGSFFVSDGRQDILISGILSRKPSTYPAPYSREDLMGVLTAVVLWSGWTSEQDIAAVLEVDPSIIHQVTFGPSGSLFRHRSHYVRFSSSAVKAFLLDPNRSGEFFVSATRRDDLLIRVLSRQQHRGVLMEVLTVLVVWEHEVTLLQIADILEVDPEQVRDVIFGPAKYLFSTRLFGDIAPSFSTSWIRPFLQDVKRSGEFSVSRNNINAVHIRRNLRSVFSHPWRFPPDVIVEII